MKTMKNTPNTKHTSMEKYNIDKNYKIIFKTPDDGCAYFFGYYDKSPVNKDNDKLLAHRTSFDGRDVGDGDIAEIGYFNLDDKKNEFIKIDETLAWNWQQGSQLQWLGPDFNTKIIYNSIKDNKFVSLIYDINKKTKDLIPFPVYAVHPKGKEALGVNYERLYWCRPGYNYKNIIKKEWNVPIHPDDGIFLIDLETKEIRLTIKTKEIANSPHNEEILNSNNWLEHIMYNPSGNRLMFLHRWNKGSIDKSRLFTSNPDGNDIYMFPDNKFYSHYCWKNNSALTIWTNSNILNNLFSKTSTKSNIDNLFNKIYLIIKKIIPKKIKRSINPGSTLVNFEDKTNKSTTVDKKNIISKNGHQTWIDDNNLLFDSYQDSNNFRYLKIYNQPKQSIKTIGRFYSNYNDATYRCDLHPRLNNDKTMIIIDSAHHEKRKILIIKI